MSRTIRNFNFTIIPPSCFTTLSSPFSFMLYYMLIYIYWLDFSYLVKFPHEAPHNPKSLFVLILLPCEFCIMLIMHDEYMPTKLPLQFWHHLLYFKITRCWANWTAIDKMGWYTPDSTLQSTYTLVRQILSKSNITNVTLLILSIGNRSLCGVVVKLIAL